MSKFYKKLILIIITLSATSTLLSGCLPVIFTGAATSVYAFAKDRSAGDTLGDVKIANAIKAKLIKSNFRKIYSRIEVNVVKGRVLLTGLVEKEEYMVTAIQVAWSQSGVNDVINEMTVDKGSNNFNLVQYTRDTMITSQIKSKMILDRDIKFVNITVITIRDVVYLFGIARSDQEIEKVANIAANIHGVKNVVSHVKIDSTAKKHRVQDNNKLVDNDSINNEEMLEIEKGLAE